MNLLKSFSVYSFSALVTRGISFLLIPFFTNHLSRLDYGVITIFSNSIYFIAPFMNMGIGEVLTVEYNQIPRVDLEKFISTSLVFSFTIFFITLLIVFFTGSLITDITGLTSSLLYLICLLSIFNFFIEYLFTIFRNQNNLIAYSALNVGRVVVELSIAIFLIKQFEMGYMGRVNGLMISAGICFVIALFYLIKTGLFKLKFSKEWFKVILKRGLPTIPFFMMIFVLNNSDNYFINYYHGKDHLGDYGLACQVAMMINLVSSSFIIPFYPFFYSSLREGSIDRVKKAILFFILFLLLSVISLSLLSPILFSYLISNKFQNSLSYITLLSLGQMWWACFQIILGYLYYRKENKKLYYVSALTICFAVLVDFMVIKKSYLNNWAWANMLSFFFCFLLAICIYWKKIARHLKFY